MKGDFTRFTHDPAKHYSGVLKQQGRVDVDADWNEYVQIRNYINRTETQDIIGRCGVPNSVPDSFKIERLSGDNTKLEVKPGRIYVQGLLCESDEAQILPNPGTAGIYLAYLDVWQRHITAVEDNGLPEIALGGVDTTTRVKTEWQVRLKDVSNIVDGGNLDCKPFCCCGNPWAPEEAMSTGMLAARAEKKDETTKLCEVEAQGGYRGLENRLYRVEIHTGGTAGKATFKWSRDNGSVVFQIQNIKYQGGKSTITLKQLGKDEVLTLHVGDWVEVLCDDTELAFPYRAGTLAQVASEADGADLTKGIIVIKTDLSEYIDKPHCKIRRWDHKGTGDTSIDSDGAIPVTEGDYAPLENGVEVCFKSGGIYRPGDYWMIPARTKVRDVLWPKEGDTDFYQSRHGIEHYYCALALIDYKDGVWGFPHDCRRIFPPLTELKSGGCCITVNEGESIQQAVDSAIAAGGGCVCICGGVYRMNGPLVISNARDLNIYGVNAATVLHFEGADKDGDGGILLTGCKNITLSNMFILADNLPALISAKAGMDSRLNLNLTLDNLTLFNNTISMNGQDRRSINCAVRLGHTRGVSIENCRMVADIGIISLFGDQLPEAHLTGTGTISIAHREGLREPSHAVVIGSADTGMAKDGDSPFIARPTDTSSTQSLSNLDYGIGVHELRMNNVSILYRTYGIWSLKSVGWRLTDCRINTTQAGGKLRRAAMQYRNSYRSILERIDEAMFGKGSTTNGTAIKAFIWKDCTVAGCSFSGKIGMYIWAWLGGEASDTMLSVTHGMITLWQHDSCLNGNRIESSDGIGFAFAGSYRASVRENHVRGAARALENVSIGQLTGDFSGYIDEIVKHYRVSETTSDSASSHDKEHYPWMALWMLMEEICIGLGLAALRDHMQERLNAVIKFKDIPVLLLASAYLTPRLGKLPDWLKKVPMPVIALRVEENDLEAADAIIRLRNFVPMGGMRVGENRITTLTGQAIQIKANKYTVNPHIIIILWRYLFRHLPVFSQNLSKAVADKDIPEERKTILSNIFTTISELLTKWGTLSESMLETDYRIENNSIRSRGTAIESNLFELAIQNNHITLEESAVANDEIADIAEMLNQYSTFKNLAVGMRQFSKAKMDSYIKSIDISGDTATAREYQRDLGEISCRIGSMTKNNNLKCKAQELNAAISESNTAKISESLVKVVEILQSYVDTCGIWIKGAGCRIVGNQIIVPMDVDPKTWAQGGIRFWDDEGTPVWLFAYVQLMLENLLPGLEIPSLLSVTETLIDNNEIIRGTQYGIEIGGIKNMPGGMGLVDLKLRGNQISDMAGAGIMFHEQSISIYVDIGDNRIMDCGSFAQRDFFADQKGGIVIRNAASCRIHNNRIRCSSNLTKKIGMFGVDARTVYGLTVTDNHIQHNESSGYQAGRAASVEKKDFAEYAGYYSLASLCGAVRLLETRGEVGMQDNDILMLRGIGSGLLMGYEDAGRTWGNFVKSESVKYMFKKVSFKEGTQTAGDTATATEAAATDQESVITNVSVQGNHFESLINQSFIAFVLANIKALNFSGNNIRVTAPTVAPGYILNVERGVIAHNMLDTLNISQMAAGVIASNCSNQAIAIPAGVTAGLNTP